MNACDDSVALGSPKKEERGSREKKKEGVKINAVHLYPYVYVTLCAMKRMCSAHVSPFSVVHLLSICNVWSCI